MLSTDDHASLILYKCQLQVTPVYAGRILPGDGSAFSLALAPLGLPCLEGFTFFSSTTSSSAIFSFSFSALGFFDLSEDFVAKDSLACCVGAGLEPSDLPKNLLQRGRRQQLAN